VPAHPHQKISVLSDDLTSPLRVSLIAADSAALRRKVFMKTVASVIGTIAAALSAICWIRAAALGA
jgi:hypothetical protein